MLSSIVVMREGPAEEKTCWSRFRNSTKIVIIIVCLSLFNDSLLLTLVDPILPEMLYDLEHPQQSENDSNNPNDTLSLSQDRDVNKDINNQGRYGYLIAAKGIAQFVCNPFVGYIVTRFGYRKPMLFGSLVLLLSTLAFPYSKTYWMLIVTRVLQGISSSLTAVTALGLVAATFKDDYRRGNVIGYAFSGLSIGIIAGPVYGSLLFEFVNPAFPFILLSGIMSFAIFLQLLTMKRESSVKHLHGSLCTLLKDPYIIIVALNIFLLNLDVSIVLAFLPIRLLELINASTWQLGIVVLPTSVGYLAAGLIFPRLVRWFPRWIQGLVGLFFSSLCLMALAYSITFTMMLVVTGFLGLAVGLISTSMQPIFALVVDKRHSEVYGNVYAISDMAVCLSMSLGPLVGGPLVYAYGFQSLVYGAAILDMVCTPITIFLRDIPGKKKIDNEKAPLLKDNDSSAGNPSA
ncbi:synaptic vesicular amine transporter-like [Octopus sinensis]|uniref:Synaptic vesicular amine transporter-like n=1 Tax=Octopus sinensis TaxID=2607531 RepID=A0A6P7S8G7_9MOLL|nr:synaptic vesicular amine transporter-like [Octopus sinensis]